MNEIYKIISNIEPYLYDIGYVLIGVVVAVFIAKYVLYISKQNCYCPVTITEIDGNCMIVTNPEFKKDHYEHTITSYYVADNQIESVCIFKSDLYGENFIQIGHETAYHQNGQIAFCKYFENGEIALSFDVYYDNGNKCKEIPIVDGKINGIYKSYFQNGKLMATENYLYNILQGEWFKYFEDGSLRQSGTYLDDNWHGHALQYHTNGKLEIDGIFKKGVLISDKFYYDNGQLKFEGRYSKGRLDGEILVYDRDGALIKTDIYKRGTLIKTHKTNGLDSYPLDYSCIADVNF